MADVLKIALQESSEELKELLSQQSRAVDLTVPRIGNGHRILTAQG